MVEYRLGIYIYDKVARPEETTKGVRLDGKETELIRYFIIHGSVEEVEGMTCG